MDGGVVCSDSALKHNTFGMTVDKDMELFYWIDWPCVDQSNPAPHMAALPAYVAASSALVSAWSETYVSRAWCRIELMMANSFMISGDKVFVIEDRFRDDGQNTVAIEKFRLPDPADGALTNPCDHIVIASLRSTALGSKTFSCGGLFKKHSTASLLMGCVFNILLCCQCCGLIPWYCQRNVEPVEAVMYKITPIIAAPVKCCMPSIPGRTRTVQPAGLGAP